MNINEYISSGILESYVLGVATPEERKEVDMYSSMYPVIKSELEAIEKTMHSYVTEHSITPPPQLKDKILAQIATETSAEPFKEPVMRSLNENMVSGSSRFSAWSIAASLLFLVSATFAIYYGVQNGQLHSSMNKMAQANTALSDSMKALASNVAQMQNDMAILKDPMYKMVELKGLKISPESKAMVCWCPTDKKVYVEIEKLPSAPSGMQYQLWAIVDGKPVSEGMLTAGNGLHPMKDIDHAQAFAISLEKAGGSESPKGDIYVMGTI